MPVVTETYRNIRTLNIIFAASALAALASMLWMLKDDHERPWREHQTDYFNVQAALAHFERLELSSPESQSRRTELAAQLDAALEKAREHEPLEKALAQREAKLNGELQAAAARFGNLNAEYQVVIWEYEEHKTLHGPEHPATVKVFERMKRDEAKLDELRKDKETLEDALQDVQNELRRLRAPVEAARKALSDFDKRVADAERREQMYGKGITRTLFNLPGLDFAPPKGVPGRQEIKQVVLPDVRQDYSFLQSYSIDRCTTCHVAIDQPGASLEKMVAQSEAALRAINAQRVAAHLPPLEVVIRPKASSAHGGHGQPHAGGAATPSSGDAYAAAPEQRPASRVDATHGESEADKEIPARDLPPFDKMSPDLKKRYAAALVDTLNEHLKEEGREPIRFEQPLLAHPRLDLFVSPNSPHPMSRMGCTSCHEGNGQETDFMYAAHTPANREQEHEWSEKYVITTWGMPQATFHLIEEFWDRLMMPPKYTQATCAKCHTQISDLASYRGEGTADKLVEGRKLYTQLGCINCHLVEGLGDSRRVGPDLTHVNHKLDTGFLHRWIWYPADFRPSTRMPHFYMQENNLPSSRNDHDSDPMLRTETEVQAMTHYLQTFTRPHAPEPLPEGIEGDPKRGAELFVETGCLACHASLGTVDPRDEQGRAFGRKWVEDDLRHAGVPSEEAAARAAKMTLNEQSLYAIEHFTRERHAAAMRELDRLRSTGGDTDSLYIPPDFTRFAPELSGIGTKLAPNPDDPVQVERGRRWLYNWLREPAHYHPGTKMPRLFGDNYYWREPDVTKRRALADKDILDVTAYLLTQRHDTFKPEPIATDDRHHQMAQSLIRTLLEGQFSAAAADRMVNDTKHAADDEMGPLSRAILKQVERSLSRDEALAKIQSQDLHGKQMLFLGAKMITHYGCNACHTIAGFETATRPGTEMTFWGEKRLAQLDFAFFSPGFEQLKEQHGGLFTHLYPESAEYEHLIDANGNEPQQILYNRAAFAYHKLRNPRIWDRAKIKKPYEKLKMPNFNLSPGEAEALTTYLLSRVHPLVSSPVQVDYAHTTWGGIAAGRHFVDELNCVGCHKIEDNEPLIQQYFLVSERSGGRSVDELNAPPWLHGQGAKVNHNWFHVFLRNVEMLRPWLKIRMPSFHLNEREATTLVSYFANAAMQESSAVHERLGAVHRFVDAAQKRAGMTSQARPDADGRTPGDDWFSDETMAAHRKFLEEYTLRYRLVRPVELDPTRNEPANLVAGYAKAVGNAGFLADLYDIEYPFVEPPRPAMSDERFALGEQMLLEMKCLACHVFGDPYKEGSNSRPTAPNLNLTSRRLQRGWVRGWLQYPARIQPGTKMPQWWGDGGSLVQYPKELYDEFAGKYGPTHEAQMTLLEDFMYEAGLRNYTVIDPTLPKPSETPEGEEIQLDEEDEPEIELDE